MHIIHVRMTKPTSKDVKYLNDRLSSRFKAKQILPTLGITFEEYDSQSTLITSDLIAEDLGMAEKKISVPIHYFITLGDGEDTQFSLPDNKADGLNANGR